LISPGEAALAGRGTTSSEMTVGDALRIVYDSPKEPVPGWLAVLLVRVKTLGVGDSVLEGVERDVDVLEIELVKLEVVELELELEKLELVLE